MADDSEPLTPRCFVQLDGRFPIVSVLWHGRRLVGALLPFLAVTGLPLATFLAAPRGK